VQREAIERRPSLLGPWLVMHDYAFFPNDGYRVPGELQQAEEGGIQDPAPERESDNEDSPFYEPPRAPSLNLLLRPPDASRRSPFYDPCMFSTCTKLALRHKPPFNLLEESKLAKHAEAMRLRVRGPRPDNITRCTSRPVPYVMKSEVQPSKL